VPASRCNRLQGPLRLAQKAQRTCPSCYAHVMNVRFGSKADIRLGRLSPSNSDVTYETLAERLAKHGLKRGAAGFHRRQAQARDVCSDILDRGDLVAVDSVLRFYDVEPSEIPTKGRMPVRSAYFGRNEITRRCRDMMRERRTIKAEGVTIQAMKDKGLDTENRKMRRDFTRRILVSLHELRKAGQAEKIGHGRGVTWRLRDEALQDC
jgi:hypothetical protein